MKKAFILFLGILFICQFSYAQIITIVAEDFDGTVSFTSSRTSGAVHWDTNRTYYVSSPKSYRGEVPSTQGGEIILTSPEYDLSSYSFVSLQFDHICKVDPTDIIQIEYCTEINAGVFSSWAPFPATLYQGSANNYQPIKAFNATSYSQWAANDRSAQPTQDWWKHETFDVGSEVAGLTAKFRFVIKKGQSSEATHLSYGWLIDNFVLYGSKYPIANPTVEFISPFISDTVHSVGPYVINARVKANTPYPLDTIYLKYTANYSGNTSFTDSILMTSIDGDSIWKAEIPQIIAGTEVVYSIKANDTIGNSSFTSQKYFIKEPNTTNNNSAALVSIDYPQQVGVIGGDDNPIVVTIRNTGINKLDSVIIKWSINGNETTAPYTWKGSLPWDFTKQVTIGSYISSLSFYDTLVVWVEMPNGVIDPDISDNMDTVILYGCSGGPMQGEYIIGRNPGAHFETFADMQQILNICGMQDDVILKFQSGTHEGNIHFTNLTSKTNGYTITVTSQTGNKGDVIFKAPSNQPVFTFNNTNNFILEAITIDARQGNRGIDFAGTTTPMTTCSNIVINNCDFLLGSTQVVSYNGIHKTTNMGTLNGLIVKNCTFDGGYAAIHLDASNAGINRNIVIDSNSIKNTTTRGISIYGLNNYINSISFNDIKPRLTSITLNWSGIYFENVPNVGNIIGNRIRVDGKNTVSGTLRGIESNLSISNGLIANNEIYFNTEAQTSQGLYFYEPSSISCLHNTIFVTTAHPSPANNSAMYFFRGSSMTIKNNILKAEGVDNTYTIYLNGTYLWNYDINYNNYLSSVNIGYISPEIKMTLNDWQETAVGDKNSISVDPAFIDPALNLDISDYTIFSCLTLPDVKQDILGKSRIGTTNLGCYAGDSYLTNGALLEVLNWEEKPSLQDTSNLQVVLYNGGLQQLSNVTINWNFNGVTKSKIWQGTLLSEESITINLDTIGYKNGYNSLIVYIDNTIGGISYDDTLKMRAYCCDSLLNRYYTVGQGKDFEDFAGVVSALQCGINGQVTIAFEPGTYIQNVTIGAIPTTSPSDRVTITSTTGNYNDVVFQREDNGGYPIAPVVLKGTSNISFRNVSFSGISPTPSPNYKYAHGIIIKDASKNVTIKDCYFEIPSDFPKAMLNFNYNAIKITEGNSDIYIENNTIQGGSCGIYAVGINTPISINNNITLKNNIIKNIDHFGIYARYCENTMIQGNSISQRTGNFVQEPLSGIDFGNGTANILRNKIHAISLNAGISVTSINHNAASPALIANNEIIGSALVAATNSGIYLQNNTFANIYHNSLFIDGSVGGRGICVSSTTGITLLNIKNNNIIMNTTASDHAIYLYGSSSDLSKYAVNNNNYYSKAGNIGYAAYANNQTLSQWKTTVKGDVASVNIASNYANPSNNLSLMDSTGLSCPRLTDVSTDINDTLRANRTTIGAYHFIAKKLDVALETFIDFPQTVSAGDLVNIKVRFRNVGVDTIRSLSIGRNANGIAGTSHPWTGILPPNQLSDTILLGTFPAISNWNKVTVYTHSPNGQNDEFAYNDTLIANVYACDTALNGTYTIGTAKNYVTVADAVAAFMHCGINGPVRFLIDPGTYTENIVIDSIRGSSINNTITFTSSTGNAHDVSISAYPTAVQLTNASNLLFKNISVYSAFIAVSFEENCSNIEIRGCNIKASATATVSISRAISYVNSANSGKRLKDIRIIDNKISGGYYNIYLNYAGSGSGTNMGYLTIDSNSMMDAYNSGIYSANNGQYKSISYNTIITRVASTSQNGIYLLYSTIDEGIIGNRIHIGSTSNCQGGIYLSNVNRDATYNASGNALIANNEIILAQKTGTLGGIYCNSANANIYNNSVYVAGTTGNGISVPSVLTTNSPGLDIRNNIFMITSSGSNSYPINFAAVAAASVAGGTILDYNNYYSTGQYVANIGNTLISTLFDLQLATKQNNNSVNILPAFTDINTGLDLSYTYGLECPKIQNVDYDINGENRRVITSMGAYKLKVGTIDAGIASIIGLDDVLSDGNNYPIKAVVKNYGDNPISSASISLELNGTNLVTGNYTFSRTLAYGEYDTIPLGNFSFSSGMNTLKAIISLTGDIMQLNDTLTVSRSICNSFLAGEYIIGPSGSADYKNFDAFLADVKSCGIRSDIVLKYETGTYGQLDLTDWNIISHNNNLTITSLKQNKDSVRFLNTGTANLVTLNKTSNVTFEHITLNATSGGSVVIFSGFAENITINNCKLLAMATTSNTNYNPVLKNAGIGKPLYGLTVTNCLIDGGYYGVRIYGVTGDYCQNIRIDSNTFTDQYFYGIELQYANANISHNKITARSSNQATTWYGMKIDYMNRKTTVSNNKIFTDNQSITGNLYGIWLNAVDTMAVINNEVRFLDSKSSTTRGIYVANVKIIDCLHNSVLLTGTGSSTPGSFQAFFMGLNVLPQNLNVKNNLFIANGGGTVPYAISLGATNQAMLTSALPYCNIDNNIYYSSNNFGFVEHAIPSVLYTLSDWQTIVTSDINSKRRYPVFVNVAQNLKIVNDYAFLTPQLSQVMYDIEGASRNTLTAKGAYESVYIPTDASLVDFVDFTVPTPNQNLDIKVQLANGGNNVLTSAKIHWIFNGKLDSITWTGNLNTNETAVILLETKPVTWGRNSVEAWVSAPNGSTDMNLQNDTISKIGYSCSGPLSGVYTVGGTSPDFLDVNQGIELMQGCGISGSVTLQLEAGNYGDIAITGSIPGANDMATVTITSTTANASDVIIKTSNVALMLQDAKYLKFEHITFDATNGTKAIQFLSACENIEITNCTILLDSTSTNNSHAGIYKGGSTGIVKKINITNNTINGGYYGIYLIGGISMSAYATDIVIDSNIITNSFYRALHGEFTYFTSISYNTIIARDSTNISWDGFHLANSNGVVVSSNRIWQLGRTVNSRGMNIVYFNLNNDTGLISNNEIILYGTAITNSSRTSGMSAHAGININSSYANIIHNSIYLQGKVADGIFVGTSNRSRIENNNIMMMNQDTTSYPIYLFQTGSSNWASLRFDYNNYYSAAGSIGMINGGRQSSLPAWQTVLATGAAAADPNTVSKTPAFVNLSKGLDLIDYTNLFCFRNPKVLTDINGNNRSEQTTRGAYMAIVTEGKDLEIREVLIPVNIQATCVEEYLPVKYIIRNIGNVVYDFAADSVDLHFSMSGPIHFDTVITIKQGTLNLFEVDTIDIVDLLDVSYGGIYDIKAWLSSDADTTHHNDTLTITHHTNKVTLPFNNDFSTNILEGIDIVSLAQGGLWKVVQTGYDTIIQPQFGTGKLIFDDPSGAMSRLIIGQLELNRTLQPKLEFWYEHDSSHSNTRDDIDVRIIYGGKDSTLFKLRRYSDAYTGPTWVKYSVDLSYFQDSSCIFVYFDATSNGIPQHIDRISISSDQDIAITKIIIPELSVCNLKNQKLEVMVSNETSQDFDFNQPQNRALLHVEVKENGMLKQRFTHPMTGMLPGLTSQTIEISSTFNYLPGRYEIISFLEMLVADANPLNNIQDTSFRVNPNMSLQMDPVSGNNACLYGESKILQEITITNTGNMELSGLELILHIDTIGTGSSYYITMRETLPGIIPVGGFLKHSFTGDYTVPWNSEYYLNAIVYLGCDSMLLHKEAATRECVDMKDAYIVNLNTPSGGVDKSGELINLGVTISNRSDVESFSSLQVTAIIEDSQGNKLAEFTESGLSVEPLGRLPYIFTTQYTVPNDSVYNITVFISNGTANPLDNYPHNDTLRTRRVTDYVDDIESIGRNVSMSMEQNIPNPANNNTLIRYNIPESGEVTFHIHSMNGQILYDRVIQSESGYQTIEINTSGLSSGIYMYSMEFNGHRITRKMTIKR